MSDLVKPNLENCQIEFELLQLAGPVIVKLPDKLSHHFCKRALQHYFSKAVKRWLQVHLNDFSSLGPDFSV